MTRYRVSRRATLLTATALTVAILGWNSFAAAPSRLESGGSAASPGFRNSSVGIEPTGRSWVVAQAPQKAPDRSKEIKKLLGEAEDLADEGKFDAALNKVGQARALDASDKRIAETEADIKSQRTQAEARQKEARVKDFLAKAKGLIKEKQFEKASAALDQAAQLDPKNSGLLKLRQTLKEEQESAARQRVAGQVEKLLDQARTAIKANKFDAAAAALDQAAQLDPKNKSVIKLRSTLASRKLAAAKEQEAQARKKVAADADRLLSDAKAAIKGGKYDAASASLDKVAQLDPKNKTLASYREWLKEEQQAATKEQVALEDVHRTPGDPPATRRQHEPHRALRVGEPAGGGGTEGHVVTDDGRIALALRVLRRQFVGLAVLFGQLEDLLHLLICFCEDLPRDEQAARREQAVHGRVIVFEPGVQEAPSHGDSVFQAGGRRGRLGVWQRGGRFRAGGEDKAKAEKDQYDEPRFSFKKEHLGAISCNGQKMVAPESFSASCRCRAARWAAHPRRLCPGPMWPRCFPAGQVYAGPGSKLDASPAVG